MSEAITIRPAVEADVAVILQFIRDLAKYEHLEHEVVATEGLLRERCSEAVPTPKSTRRLFGTANRWVLRCSSIISRPSWAGLESISRTCMSARKRAVTAWGAGC